MLFAVLINLRAAEVLWRTQQYCRKRACLVDILSALNLWTTHPLSSGLPLFLIPELRAVSGNLRQPEVKCFAYK